MIVAELRVVPVGEGTSMEQAVKHVTEALQARGVRHEVGPMGTTLQTGSLNELMETVQACHEAARLDAGRIVTELVIDERMDKTETMESLREV